MVTYICILRGINVGGHRSIKMDALKVLFSSLGFQNSQTYIQSGNIIFQVLETENQILENQISKAIIETFDFKVPVLVMKISELKLIISKNPFLADEGKNLAHLHVTFLAEIPETSLIEKIMEGNYQEDEFQLVGKAIYLYCPNSYSNSKLTNGFFESKLNVSATTRNWKTTITILSLAENN